MSAECQEKNARGLTMVAVGVNKAAEQYVILDEQTRADLASGKYHDQRRGSFGTSLPSSGNHRDARVASAAPPQPQSQPRRRRQPDDRPARPPAQRRPWGLRQHNLALRYKEPGMRPGQEPMELSTV